MEMHKIGPTQLSLRKQIHLCLRPEETVLWEDSPAKGCFFRKANIKLLLLALGFLIVGILWLWAGVHPQYETFPYAMIVLGVIFFIRSLREIWVLNRSRYAVTDRRVILVTLGRIVFLPYHQIPCVEVEFDGEDTCTLYLQLLNVQGRARNHWSSRGNYRAALVHIANGTYVASLIRQQMRKAPPA